MRLKIGYYYRIKDITGETVIAEYMGRQQGFSCCICGKGDNAHTFNIYGYSNETIEEAKRKVEQSEYETWGYGNEHLPEIVEELGIIL